MKNQFKPFRALRYSSSIPDPGNVLAPPYDVISPEEQRRLHEIHTHNIVHLDYGIIKGDDSVEDNRYTRAQEYLRQWMSSGVLVRDSHAAYYLYEHVYRVEGATKQLRGILGAAQLFYFDEGVVLPHENTMPGPIQDRLDLTKACEVNLSPIYTLFDDPTGRFFALTGDVYSSPPTSESVTIDGDIYRVWVVTDKQLVEQIFEFMGTKKLLIADGHHRYTTALHYRDYCRSIGSLPSSESESTMLFATPLQNDGLTIFPTHRVVFGIANFNPDEFLNQLSRYFNTTMVSSISELNLSVHNESQKVIGVMFPGRHGIARLTLKPDVAIDHFFPDTASSILKGLDVSILQYIVLQGILGFSLDDISAQKGLRYLKSDAAVMESVEKNEVQVAFVLQATRLDEMRDVCLNGEKMPQKSTYFYPKLVTGLVLNPVSAS